MPEQGARNQQNPADQQVEVEHGPPQEAGEYGRWADEHEWRKWKYETGGDGQTSP